MTRSMKFSTLAAALVVGFLSIYATLIPSFTTANYTTQSVTVTLNLASGAADIVTVAPGQALPTDLNGDQVSSMTVYGAVVPAGANAIVPNPAGGTVTVLWTVINNSDGSTSVAGGTIDPTVAG